MIEKLFTLARRLRDPKNGCPWDLKQDFESFKMCLVNEANEVVEAIDNKNIANLQEELGDTLFNVIFLINLAEEKKMFTLNDVVDGIYNKMVHRHPHVFGDKHAKTAEEAYEIFLQQKKQTKEQSTSE
ncbi:MAG: nucleotide pyrophosphohydrolase [Planctomycetes bacterium]|nr:nucleotide pyrophosphohydrolase [Planctomycetota bacterium]HNZ66256.1 MazG nucleotide pyrophosphohydrolase domain-containing protein [Planctomycetota bacterium]HPY75491.1 MazG nucleotide pyrophosphohydrolase domain-containing protein [Planctomycetota bacterium]HQB00331.1 MazG nucleotide pyrophosphohydrolase domain-containing protein [Planctomycetota bacterium]